LMQNPAKLPVPTPKFPFEVVVLVVLAPVLVVVAFLVLKRRKKA